MQANYGFFIMLTCCLVSIYGVLASLMAAKWRHRQLYISAKIALTISTILVSIAGFILFDAFLDRDYSFEYVAKNSSNDLPFMFTITAFWSSLEGSHMLWTWLQAIVACIAIWTYTRENEHVMPYVSATLQAVLAWMFYLALDHSDPFAQQLPAPPNGRGMNELLQNFYMAIHPPMLFVGYVGLAIPFAYSLAALAYGDITQGWLKSVRRWTLFSWVLLTAAITLGGRWAYVELGWAGYWAWDPVENSSMLPWIMATALLHSLLVQDKLGQLKRLTIILSILGFFLCFFGTFITRSGIISSVHSFAESPIGENYLFYLIGVMGISIAIYMWRAPSLLPAETEKVWGISKESALVVTQFLLLSLAAIVFIGTMFPIVSEWVTDKRITVQAPYFNAFAPWIGLGFIVVVAIGNLMRYQSDKIPHGKPIILGAVVFAIPVTAWLVIKGEVLRTDDTWRLWAQIVGMYLSAWAIGCLLGDFYYRLKDIRFAWGLFFRRNLAYTGALLAHIGLMVAIVGFLGNYRGLEKKVTLEAGESTQLFGYEFKLQKGIEVKKVENATLFAAPVEVIKDGKNMGVMEPAQSQYPTKMGQTFHEIGIKGDLWNDVYLVMVDFDKATGKSVTFNINVNPTVRMVWLAIIIMCVGGMIALFDQYRGDKSRDVVAGNWEIK
ncbi:MAG: heme lyase CcmF/NrfE family subunit [Pseudobacteriovorax sp.]|nr:heme lyase CcmF/NrfE family subunit [Pseudobacteriovorax sp.]